jgi:hypothetical protein
LKAAVQNLDEKNAPQPIIILYIVRVLMAQISAAKYNEPVTEKFNGGAGLADRRIVLRFHPDRSV